MSGVRRGAFTCVGWQVTLCDPIWQVTSRSSEVGITPRKSYMYIGLYRRTADAGFNADLMYRTPSVVGEVGADVERVNSSRHKSINE